MADTTTKVSNFFTTYKTPILIGLGVAVVAAFVYYYVMKKQEGFDCGGRHPGRYGPGYGGYPRGYMQYPGQESLYGQMSEEGFYDGNPPMKGYGGHKKIILFYAPWCPHCKSFMENEGGRESVWQSFVRKHGGRKDLTIDQINCDEKPEAATQYGVGGFPTIMLFQGDKSYTYDGDRSLETLERFLEAPSN